MKKVLFCAICTALCLRAWQCFGQEDTLAGKDYLVAPGGRANVIWVEANDPMFYEGPKLDFPLLDEHKQPLDSVTLRVFDADHRFLGEYCSSRRESSLEPGLVILVDTAAIDHYGTYYIEANKPGYKTKEIKYELVKPLPGESVIAEGFVLKRDMGGSGWWWAAVVAVLVAGVFAWRLTRRRKRQRGSE